MKGRAIIPLAVGLAIGVFAIKYFVNVVKKAKGASTDMVQVVCANSDIAQTMEIKESMLETKSLPKALAPKLSFSDVKEVAGRVTSQTIVTGMPIVPTLLAPKGTPAGMNVRIKERHRAFSLQVDESAGVAGWLKPGSRVDVMAVMSSRSGGSNESISKVILQNVEVLAVGQDIGTKSDGSAAVPKTVTLSVPFEQLSKLNLAATKGKIRLAMRNQTESEADRDGGQTTDNDLVGAPDQQKASGVGGLLAGFFSNLPKPGDIATDKEPRARKPEPADEPAPAPATRPAPSCEWVEVYVGSEFKEELGFSRGTKGWRLVSSRNRKGLRDDKDALQDLGLAAPTPADGGQPSPLSRVVN